MGSPPSLPWPFPPAPPSPRCSLRPAPARRQDPGLARRLPPQPPAEPGLTNFGLPARLAPSSAPPLGLPGPGPLRSYPVGHSKSIAEAQTRLCSWASLLSSPRRLCPCPLGSISPVPGAPSPPSGPSLCRTDKQPQLNQTLLPLLPPPPPPPRPGRGPRPIARLRLPSRVGCVCTAPPIPWRKAGHFWHHHQSERARNRTGVSPSQ